MLTFFRFIILPLDCKLIGVYIWLMSEFALYIHYPFCLSRCPYCGFASSVLDKGRASRYHMSLKAELSMRAGENPWRGNRLRSIYLGGGTPTLMSPEYLEELFNRIRESFVYPPEIEVTIETNPGTCSGDSLSTFRRAGVNRLSIGAQSFQDDELRLLGRTHSPGDIETTVRQARQAGFDNLSLDLIYGIPGQSVDSFIESVQQALDLEPQHLSTYSLTIEEGTEFERMVKSNLLPEPDPDLAAEQYIALCDVMRRAGFDHYELTNFARPGFRSEHNMTYWRRIPYLGLGVAAHSFNGQLRTWNPRDIDEYINRLADGKYPKGGGESLSPVEVLEEQVYLGLRTSDGIESETIREICGSETVQDLLKNGFLVINGGRLQMVEERWLMLDEVVLKLLSGG